MTMSSVYGDRRDLCDSFWEIAKHISSIININICSIILKWDGCKKLKYDMITRWDEYE